MPVEITLNQEEKRELFIENSGSGGFQSLMKKLQNNFNKTTKKLILNDDLLEKIPRYTYNYTNGGWQKQLEKIFSGHPEILSN